jgi:hypothetical protein
VLDKKAGLADRERLELASACRTVARVLNAAPEAIDADPQALRARLKRLPRTPDGLSSGHWRNTMSRLTKALHLVGTVSARRRSKTPLPPSWQTLVDSIPDRNWRCQLMRLARYCADQNVEPGKVHDAVADAFGEAQQRFLVERPRQRHREACLS